MSKKLFLSNNKHQNNTLTKSLNKIKNSPEYIQNQKQIDCITNVLIKHADIPPKLIDWLIESVQKNTIIEYNTFNK